MEFQTIFIYLSVVGFIRSVLTITGTDATWACVCGVVTQRDAVVRVQHGCQQTARSVGEKNERGGQSEMKMEETEKRRENYEKRRVRMNN